METVKDLQLPGIEGRAGETVQRTFRAVKVLHRVLGEHMSFYICPNPQSIQHQERVQVYVAYGLWVTTICQRRFIDCSNVSLSVEHQWRGSFKCMGGNIHGLSVLSNQFF